MWSIIALNLRDVSLDYLFEKLQTIIGVEILSLSREISDLLFKTWTTRIEPSPIVSLMVAVIRKEIWSLHRPLKLELLLLLKNSLKILIYGAILEGKLFSRGMISEDFRDIIKKLVLNMRKLPREIHSSSDHDMISTIVFGIVLQAW